jgi:NADH-quinone oxidoreductase subunit C
MHPIAERLQKLFPTGFLKAVEWRDDLTIVVKRESLHEVGQFLHDDAAMDFDYIVHVSSVAGASRTV